MQKFEKKKALRLRRKMRTRKKISGTAERPRVSICRSAAHFSAQVINDETGTTLLTVKTFGKDTKGKRANIEVCKELGKTLGGKCKEKGIAKIVFDKNGLLYHGRIKAFADGAREAGVEF